MRLIKQLLPALALLTLVIGCQPEEMEVAQWQTDGEMQLGDFRPIGITVVDSVLWLSDGDNNQLGAWTADGEMRDLITGFDRPMHIASFDGSIYVPEYGSDSIKTIIPGGSKGALSLVDSLDAPAGIDVSSEGSGHSGFLQSPDSVAERWSLEEYR